MICPKYIHIFAMSNIRDVNDACEWKFVLDKIDTFHIIRMIQLSHGEQPNHLKYISNRGRQAHTFMMYSVKKNNGVGIEYMSKDISAII